MPRKRATPDPGDQFGLFQLPETPNSYRKAVQILHSLPRAPMSLLQRKLSNAWLKNAVDTKPDQEGWYTIGTAAMSSDIGFDSNNREYLIHSARELMAIVFEWDVIAQAGKRAPWKASVLFPEVEIQSDLIRYQISKQLQARVLNPDMYALIDLNVLRKFRRASSVAIYEFCVRFERINQTPEVGWEQFRDMILGESSDAKSYKAYKVFKDKVLKPAVAEVNSQSDITVALKETYIGRKVQSVGFDVTKHRERPQRGLAPETDLEIVSELVKFGLPQTEAQQLCTKHSLKEVEAALAYTRRRMGDKKASKLDNPNAYLRQTLSNGWAVVDPSEEAILLQENPKPSKPKRQDIEAMYMTARTKEAEGYFRELNPEEQQKLVSRYNEEQEVAALRLKSSKATKGAQVAFYRWLAIDTWGRPTPELLLQFFIDYHSAPQTE